jgi:hypothetical protein
MAAIAHRVIRDMIHDYHGGYDAYSGCGSYGGYGACGYGGCRGYGGSATAGPTADTGLRDPAAAVTKEYKESAARCRTS